MVDPEASQGYTPTCKLWPRLGFFLWVQEYSVKEGCSQKGMREKPVPWTFLNILKYTSD